MGVEILVDFEGGRGGGREGGIRRGLRVLVPSGVWACLRLRYEMISGAVLEIQGS